MRGAPLAIRHREPLIMPSCTSAGGDFAIGRPNSSAHLQPVPDHIVDLRSLRQGRRIDGGRRGAFVLGSFKNAVGS
jgi:hypothetical protein